MDHSKTKILAFSTTLRVAVKHILPKSIIGRFLLIIIIPTILAQLIAIYIFYERHWENVSRHLQIALAGEIAVLAKNAEHSSLENIPFILTQSRYLLHFNTHFSEDELISATARTYLPQYHVFSQYLKQFMTMPYHLYNMQGDEAVGINIQLPHGVLTLNIGRKRLATPTTYIFIMWMSGVALLLLLISVIFMRNQLRPIIRLANAADQYGKGQLITHFKPEGSTEIRKAAEAFIDMKQRIDRQVTQRTEMLAGVSHDLKTPLTRIKLQLALLEPSKEHEALKQDVQDMETMVQGYLDFARGNQHAINSPISVADQLRSIIAGYRQDYNKFDLKIKQGINITINPNNFRRIITNILDNALRYASTITIEGQTSDKQLIIMIDDDGPGIPQTQRSEVFKPFYRLDRSRNNETGGTGLGLTVTRDLVTRYGGDITLTDSPSGGLRVIITLPL